MYLPDWLLDLPPASQLGTLLTVKVAGDSEARQEAHVVLPFISAPEHVILLSLSVCRGLLSRKLSCAFLKPYGISWGFPPTKIALTVIP